MKNERATPEYALQKTEEYFGQLRWEDIRQAAELETETGLKVAMVISEVGDQLEEKLGITPFQWSQMLLASGAAIGAALKDNKEHRAKQSERSKWN